MDNKPSIQENSFSFWKKLIFIVVFFTVTPIALGTSLFSLFSITKADDFMIKENVEVESIFSNPSSGARVYASIPSTFPTIEDGIEISDARPELVKQYLKDYGSPLEPHADFIVQMADKYGIDFRLTTAIAQQESNLCRIMPKGTYNCWGWGIHSEGTLGFANFEEGIEIVSRGLKENYLDEGYVDAEEIMSKYTPLSKGSWAFGVNQFMGEME